MDGILGVKSASQYAHQDNTVQSSSSQTDLMRSAISVINGLSGALAMTNFPRTTFMGMLLDRYRGEIIGPETKNVDDSRRVLTEMQRNEVLERKLLLSAFRCGALCLAVLNPESGLGIISYLAAASCGFQFHNYLQKQLSAVAVNEVVETPVQEEPIRLIISKNYACDIQLGKKDDFTKADVKMLAIEDVAVEKEAVEVQKIAYPKEIVPETEAEKLFEELMSEIADESASPEAEVQQPVADVSAEEVAVEADIEKLEDEPVLLTLVETLSAEEMASAGEVEMTQGLVIIDVIE